jgi:tRNA threonylcarbamoyl adenosine modification protein (Sua5/YciO/YrdC/YwlC family)
MPPLAGPLERSLSQYFSVHPTHPQQRLLSQAAEIIARGGLVVYPTDTTYALGCHIGDKNALDRVRQIRRLDRHHDLTLVCRDLSELGTYARVDNAAYRILKRLTPGPYTFLLPATREVPRRLIHPKKKTIGLRVPDNPTALGLLEALGQPMMTTTMRLPGDDLPLVDPEEIRERLEHAVDLVIDGGIGGIEPTTVVDLTVTGGEVVRQGAGQDL